MCFQIFRTQLEHLVEDVLTEHQQELLEKSSRFEYESTRASMELSSCILKVRNNRERERHYLFCSSEKFFSLFVLFSQSIEKIENLVVYSPELPFNQMKTVHSSNNNNNDKFPAEEIQYQNDNDVFEVWNQSSAITTESGNYSTTIDPFQASTFFENCLQSKNNTRPHLTSHSVPSSVVCTPEDSSPCTPPLLLHAQTEKFKLPKPKSSVRKIHWKVNFELS
jgi:hypothetical protein